MNARVVLAILFSISLISLAIFSALVFPAKAAGGGGLVQSGSTNNNGGSSSCAVTLSNVQNGDALIMAVWAVSGTTVSGVADGGDSFSKVVSSTVNVDTEEWIAVMNQGSGTITVTATLSGSVANKCIAVEVDNLLSITADVTSTGSGTSSSLPFTGTVVSFTPPADDYCHAFLAYTGSGMSNTAQNPASPFFADRTVGIASNNKQLFSFFDGNSPGSATTASNQISGVGSTIGWDEIVGCFPAGITTTTTTASTTTTTAVVCTNCGQEPNYDWLLVFPFILIIVVLLLRRR